jgi:hypothetical protein
MTTGKISLCMLSMLAIAITAETPPAYAAVAKQFQCDAQGSNDISMRARFEQRTSGRRKFNAEFEAAPGAGFTAGQRMTVLVSDVKAGAVSLRRVVGGDIAGELQLDDRRAGRQRKAISSRFPPGGSQHSRSGQDRQRQRAGLSAAVDAETL